MDLHVVLVREVDSEASGWPDGIKTDQWTPEFVLLAADRPDLPQLTDQTLLSLTVVYNETLGR